MRALLKRLFKSKPLGFEQFRHELLKFPYQSIITTYGQREVAGSYRYLQVALETPDHQWGYGMGDHGDIELIRDKFLAAKVPAQEDEKQWLTGFTHQLWKASLDHMIDAIKNIPNSNSDATQLGKEDQSLKWLQLTSNLLRDSMEASEKNPEQFIQSLLFLDLEKNSLHLKVFNLEFLFLIHEDQVWLEVYDYKKSEDQREKKLRQNFYYLAAPVFDELLKIIILHNRIIL
jgi:hypothetical protein